MKARGTMLLAVMLLLVAGSASATFVEVGDGFDSGSWTQQFNEQGVGTFTHMQVHMNTPLDLFEAPVFSAFSDLGWTTSPMSGFPVTAVADGSSTNMNFNITFAGLQSDPFMFTFQAYNGATLLESADAYWDGGAWSIGAGNTWGETSPVPEPISMIMLGALGAGMMGARKLRRKKAE